MEDFHDYFVRVQDCIPQNVQKLALADIRDGHLTGDPLRLTNLFIDCFDHHTECASRERTEKLTYAPTTRRFIARDEILVRYIDRWYVPPTIFDGFKDPTDVENNVQTKTYNELCEELTSFPITGDPTKSLELGSNTYSYLVGDVGVGKSALVSSIYRTVLFDGPGHGGYKVIPVHIDVDAKPDPAGNLHQINDAWFLKKLQDAMNQLRSLPTSLSTKFELQKLNFDNEETYITRYRRLAQHLAIRNFRLLFLLDNVDRYHFHYSRYRFSNNYSHEQRESVLSNLQHLIDVFTSKDGLGWCGLCVAFVCRSYVYQYLRSNCDDQSRKDREFGCVFTLDVDDPYNVVSSRMRIFQEACEVVLKVKSSIPAEEYRLALQSFFGIENSEHALRPEIELVRQLGHHGFRSLVGFFDGLRLDLSQHDIFARLTHNQTKNLPLLYMLRIRRRYSESAGHFPNLFLNDSQVFVPEKHIQAHVPHRPTYWLKYFILKYVVALKHRRFSQLKRLFVKLGGYDDSLFRLALGGLVSTNDSRCIDVDSTTEIAGSSDPELFATARGLQLVSSSNPLVASNIDFCFEFNYLQLVVDDNWIAIPKIVATDVISTLEYSYLFAPDGRYGEKAVEMVSRKIQSVLIFVKMLSSALAVELQHKHQLRDELRAVGAIPDMKAIEKNLDAVFAEILSRFNSPQDSKSSALTLPIHIESKLIEFFESVYKNNVVVAP